MVKWELLTLTQIFIFGWIGFALDLKLLIFLVRKLADNLVGEIEA